MAVGMGRILGNFVAGVVQRFIPNGVVIDTIGVVNAVVNPTFGAAITVATSLGLWQRVTANAATASVLGAPDVARTGALLVVTYRNASGGVMGAVTFNAIYKIGGVFTVPANGTSRTIQFMFDGTNWVEVDRSAADVTN